MRMFAKQPHDARPSAEPMRRQRPDHPEDFGRGPWWRLSELLVLGVDLRSPPPVPRFRFGDEYDDEFDT
jgi:hypothetical protein